MKFISTFKLKGFLKPILGVLLAFLVVYYALPQRTLASNTYIDNISYSKDSNGYSKIQFHVLVSFNLHFVQHTTECHVANVGGNEGNLIFGDFWIAGSHSYNTILFPHDYVNFDACSDFTYTAGNTYTNYVSLTDSFTYDIGSVPALVDKYKKDESLTSASKFYIWYNPGLSFLYEFIWQSNYDSEAYFFTEYPTLTITFPADDEELLDSFYIEGSFTQPDPPLYDWLRAIATPAGTLVAYPDPFYFPLSRASSTIEGDFTIWISGFSAGYYDFYIYFVDASTGALYPYPISNWIANNIHIVSDLPFSLPPFQEQSPYEAPSVYEPLAPITYYTENSTYETSTALYQSFTNLLAPVLLALGNNLTAYSSNFTPSNASSTGNQMGEAVVLMRSYLSNLNSFFNNLPISQFLVLYLIALVLVVIIRLVKGLIHLGKPV
jgi:hypothetical protein